jgi:hypothetical protein
MTENTELFIQSVLGLGALLSPFFFIACFLAVARELPEMLITRGRCRNGTILFLVAPFKWARKIDQLDEGEFDYQQVSPIGGQLVAVLWLTAQMLITLILFPIIGPLALIVRMAYSIKRP